MDIDRRHLLRLGALAAGAAAIARPALAANAASPIGTLGLDAAHFGLRPGASEDQSRVLQTAIDAAARDELTRRGLGEVFGHGTGHGLGIEVHEDPRIGRRRPDADEQEEAVAPGMVFTIEPGAYLPDWGGVRIEDDVVVTQTGVEVLTKATTALVEI